jgi:hypothetical protein
MLPVKRNEVFHTSQRTAWVAGLAGMHHPEDIPADLECKLLEFGECLCNHSCSKFRTAKQMIFTANPECLSRISLAGPFQLFIKILEFIARLSRRLSPPYHKKIKSSGAL